MIYIGSLVMAKASMNSGRVGRVRSVDTDTGELLENTPVYFAPRTPNALGDWIAMAQKALKEIARDKDLKLESKNVLYWLLGELDFENYLLVNQSEVAKELDMQQANVSRAIKSLTSKGVFIPGPKAGRFRTFRLNPHYGWKGKGRNHQEAIKRHNLEVIQGGKQTDAEVRAELEAKGQTRMEFDPA